MLVLASASPRRRELLMQAGFRFDVEPSRVEEALRPGEDAASFATRLAREKAAAVFERRRSVSRAEGGLLVLGADTVVVCDREICGKPQDPADAVRMLRRLGGRTHGVITGLALISSAKPEPSGMDRNIEIASAVTYVTMRTLSEAEIAAYVASGEPMDKAGGYAIQGYAGRWIPQIRGCYFNVVGLPLSLAASLIEAAETRLACPRTATALPAAAV